MKLKQYQVDAFTDKVFGGNPAAVVPLSSWLDDLLLQAIAEENNLSETAFFVAAGKGFQLRWFTPVAEVDLCGHATLASAHVLFEILHYSGPVITFETRSGRLLVEREGGRLRMSFPSRPPVPQEIPEALTRGLRRRPIELLAADDYMAVFDSEATVRSLAPDQTLLGRLDLRGIIATAPGAEVDFVSRFFAPQFGIAEDPVTGSAHCELAPYWAERLGKNVLTARQVSKRGGDIECEVKAERVFSSGVRSCSWKARSLSQRPWSRAEGEREDSIVGRARRSGLCGWGRSEPRLAGTYLRTSSRSFRTVLQLRTVTRL